MKLINLPTEIKLHILNFLSFNEYKNLYLELKCNYAIPKKYIKNYQKSTWEE